MRRWAIWAANAVLFTLGCFLLAQIAVAILAEFALPERAEVTQMRIANRAAEPARGDHNIIVARNIFRAKLTGDEVSVEQEVDIDAVATKLPLELLGTVAGEDESVSSAAINDIGTRKHQVVFIGDALDNHPSVTVHSIAREVVLLMRGGVLEKLVLKEEDDTDGRARRPARPAKNRRAARPRRTRPDDNAIADRIQKLQNDAGGRSTASLYSQARIVPKWENGKMVGVQLNQVKPGSLYEKVGIKSGDVITSLNGINIDNPQASSKLLSEFAQADAFSIEVKGRDGAIEFDASQLGSN